jgi:hypothetical protein
MKNKSQIRTSQTEEVSTGFKTGVIGDDAISEISMS